MHGTNLVYMLVLMTAAFIGTESKLTINIPSDLDMDSHLTKLLFNIKRERNFRTLFVLRQHEDDCGFDNNLHQLKVPTILLGLNQKFYLKRTHNSELLAIVCLSQAVNVDLVEKLSENLQHMRTVQIVFIWRQSSYELPGYMRHLHQLAELCSKLEMINIIIVFQDFPLTHKFYSYYKYPELFVETRSFLNKTRPIYTLRLKNLYGQPIFTATDWVEPRSMLYYSKNGTIQMTGYMMKFLITFAEKINATIKFPVPNKKSIYMQEMLNLTRNRTIDFALSLLSPKILMNMQEYTYPVETAVWGLMWPNEPIMETSELFFYILEHRMSFALSIVTIVFSTLVTLTSDSWRLAGKRRSLWLECFINGKSLRAMLGHSFPLPNYPSLKHRLSLLLTILSGFIISNMYCAFLGSVFVEPPSEPKIVSYEDILKSPLKIAIVQRNVPELQFLKGEHFWPKYKHCFYTIDTYEEFAGMRRALNTSYGYSVMSSLWPVIKQQQSHFARHLFRISEDIIFDNFNLLGMPIGENSVYKEQLNAFIGQTRTYGLMDHWFVSTFKDMLAAGKTTLVDKSQPHVVEAKDIHDFTWIWHSYLLANLVAIVVFGLERFVFKCQMKRLHRQQLRTRKIIQEQIIINFGSARKELERKT